MTENSKSNPDLIKKLTDDGAAAHIRAAVINAEWHEGLLKRAPHETIGGDLAVVAKYYFDQNSISAVLTDSLCTDMKMTPEEVFETALRHTESDGYEFMPIGDIINRLTNGAADPPAEDCPIYVLRTSTEVDGASVIASRKAMAEVGEKIGGNYTVLPSSVHEVLVIPDSRIDTPDDIRELEQIVRDINASVVQPDDLLSNHIYHYDRRTHTLSQIDTKNLSETKTLSEKTAVEKTVSRTR